MTTTSPEENVLGLSKKDLSLIRHSLEAGGKLIHQVINGLKHGTSEVQQLILQQSDVILECRVCRNLFRSLPNYLDHKRIYCPELFPNESVSLLARPFADEVPIIYPEPPDDAREFVEMSELMSKHNKRNHSATIAVSPTTTSPPPTTTTTTTSCKGPIVRESIGRALEQSSCQRGQKPQPLCLRPIKETNVAIQLVPLTTNDIANKTRNRGVQETENTSCTTEPRNLGLTMVKLANFHKLLCLKCNRIYSSKNRLIYHLKKFHIKKYGTSDKSKTNCDVGNQISDTKVRRRKESKQDKRLENENNDYEGFATKSGKPSLKKFSHLAKKSNLVKNSDMKKGWCHICNHYYSGKQGLVFHMFRMHSGRKMVYPCLFCKIKFPFYASALRHIQTIHKDKTNMKQIMKKLKASGHVENQKLQSMLVPEVKVQKCDSKINSLVQGNKVASSLDSSRTFLDPAKEATNAQKKYKVKCKKCSQIFSGIRGLTHHITRKHPVTKKNPYACHICFLAFFTSFSLNRHYRLKHNIQENVPENISNNKRKVAGRKPAKTKHIPCQGTTPTVIGENVLFHDSKKYQIPKKYYKTVEKFAHFPSLCLNCKQTFSGARDLIWHIIKQHCTNKNAFPCPFCNLSFISSASILRHTKVKHSCSDQEIADLDRKLQVWEQQKKISPNLKLNNISGSTSSIDDVIDFKNSRCIQCNHGFSGMHGMMIHISKKHTVLSDQKHKCFQCGETFCSVFAILKHMENIHMFFKPKPTDQRFNQQKTNRVLEVGGSAGPSSLGEGQQEEKEKVSCEEEKEKSLDSCKLRSAPGEDAQNSRLVRQCADIQKLQCLRCNEIFARKQGLITHIYKAHAYHDLIYSCYICMKTFASYNLACHHTRTNHIYRGSAMMYVTVSDTEGKTPGKK